MGEEAGDVTKLLGNLSKGDDSALSKVFPLVYDELHRLARACFRDENNQNTLQPTALIHEAYLRIVDAKFRGFDSRRQFTAFAATLMRRILVDHARERHAQKRGGFKTSLKDDMAQSAQEEVDVLALDEVLARLEAIDPELSRIVELRYFGGLSVEETAAILQVSEATVKRRWAGARAWLRRELDRDAASA